ncbi:unnamed protein product [Diatraea saccharalis]|uniref:Peroxidase n=1 Tax=Diatraea saccharalis TaxID=40085 RepID=A0A9P0FZ77_9NEOP|nr:unnamed protein product [Diatraea saccharalis]
MLRGTKRVDDAHPGNEDALEGRMELDQFPSASTLRQSSLMQSCPFKGAPKCPPASKRYRTHDGTCNNFNRPRWGSTMTPVQRFQPPSYSDGLQAPRVSIFGTKLPSAREISALIHSSENAENSGITHLLMQWGQFLDHDITSSSQSRGFNGSVPRCCKDGGREFMPKELMHPECFPIAVPSSDPFYGPRGVRCLDFVRSSPAPRDGCELGWREQFNQVSGYIDASPLYASSARQHAAVRALAAAPAAAAAGAARRAVPRRRAVRRLLQVRGRPRQRAPGPGGRAHRLAAATQPACENISDNYSKQASPLTLLFSLRRMKMQSKEYLYLLEHRAIMPNSQQITTLQYLYFRMAQELAHLNPHWSDEKIYQETRKIVGAMVQHITYREFLPIVLGGEVMRLFELEPLNKGYYKAYNPKINPSPASSFGSAAFRFGHSLVQSSMMRYDRFHRPINNNVSLHNELTNPSNIWSMGAVDRLLLGMVNQPIQKRDEFITEELTNHLFQTPHFDFGMDLAAINIQRGRDHGVPPYTTWREPCGLSQITGFEDLSRVMPKRVVRKFKSLYRHVDDIDLFTGGMAERPVVGGLVGPTFACIIAQQFTNLRKGDRFWYENGGFDSSFTPAQLQQIRRISFAQVLCRTLDTIDSIQPFVFLSHDNPDNDRISCQNGLLNNFDLSPWVEINSDLNNDISKSDDIHSSTTKPIKSKTTTIKPSETKKTQTLSAAASNKITQKRPPPLVNSTKAQNVTKQKPTTRLNKTDTTTKVKNNSTVTVNPNNTLSKSNVTQKIDDKLDFKNKSRRYDNSNNDLINTRKNQKGPEKTYDYDYDDDQEQIVHNVQTVVVNNLSHKRPYHRPTDFLTVTENVNKYTYLINYVPRPTESWRHTTRKPHDRNKDRDVIKVTYQTYGDTYRRPSKPHYYNKKDDQLDSRYEEFYRNNRPASQTTNRNQLHSSARSNGESILTTKATADQPLEKVSSSTENFYKLVTFGYVGTYKGDMTDHFQNNNETDIIDLRHDVISQDFSTYETKKLDAINDDQTDNMKLSTFFLYETATRPYSNLHRPTRRHDVQNDQSRDNSNKYYYIKNVLHKYGDSDVIPTDKPIELKKDIIRENYNNPGVPYSVDIEERSAPGKMDLLDEIESKAVKVKKPNNEAKTPSVAFQIIPSENRYVLIKTVLPY